VVIDRQAITQEEAFSTDGGEGGGEKTERSHTKEDKNLKAVFAPTQKGRGNMVLTHTHKQIQMGLMGLTWTNGYIRSNINWQQVIHSDRGTEGRGNGNGGQEEDDETFAEQEDDDKQASLSLSLSL